MYLTEIMLSLWEFKGTEWYDVEIFGINPWRSK